MADVNIIANRMFCYAQMNQYTLTTEQNLYVDNDMNVLCSMIVPMISTGFGVTINADAMKCNCSMPNPMISTGFGVTINADAMKCNCSMPNPTISTGFGVTINADAMKCNCSMPNPTISISNLLAIRKTFTVANKKFIF